MVKPTRTGCIIPIGELILGQFFNVRCSLILGQRDRSLGAVYTHVIMSFTAFLQGQKIKMCYSVEPHIYTYLQNEKSSFVTPRYNKEG